MASGPLLLNSSCSVYAGLSTSILYDSAHSTDGSFPVQDTQEFCLCFKKFDLILRKQISFFFSSVSHDFQMCVHRATASGSSVSCRFSSCQPEPLRTTLSAPMIMVPWSKPLKPALPVLSVLSEICSWLEVIGTFLCTNQPSEWPGLI